MQFPNIQSYVEGSGTCEVERLAGELLGQIERRKPPPPACESEPDAPLAALARHLAARLKRWKGRKRSVRTPT